MSVTTSHPLRRPALVPGGAVVLAGAGVLAAAASGALLVLGGVFGMVAILGLTFGPLVFLNLPVAVCLWVPVVFFEGVPGLINAPEAGLLPILAIWPAQLQRPRAAAVLRDNRRLLLPLVLFQAWLLVTLTWAVDPSRGIALLPSYVEVGLIYVVVMTVLGTMQNVRLAMMLFVAGTVGTITLGLAGGPSVLGGTFYSEGRLQGGLGDPNFLALVGVASVAFVVALAATSRSSPARWATVPVATLLIVGVGATQSRGGLIAAVAAAAAALYLHRGRRLRVTGLICGVLAAAGLWFAANPAALERVSTDKYGGSGREDLWQLAWQEVKDNPVRGVGLDNFAAAAVPYVRDTGTIQSVKQIERGQEAHNLYLGMLAETGLVGFLLFVTVPLLSVGAAVGAARRFDLVGDPSAALLARSVAVGATAMLAGAVFLPNATDKRLWIVLAFGPALASISRRTVEARGDDLAPQEAWARIPSSVRQSLRA